jgi:hypothetical protein
MLVSAGPSLNFLHGLKKSVRGHMKLSASHLTPGSRLGISIKSYLTMYIRLLREPIESLLISVSFLR